MLAAYTAVLGMPMCALIEPLITMDATGTSNGASAWIWKNGPLTLMSKISSQNSGVTSARLANFAVPAFRKTAASVSPC